LTTGTYRVTNITNQPTCSLRRKILALLYLEI